VSGGFSSPSRLKSRPRARRACRRPPPAARVNLTGSNVATESRSRRREILRSRSRSTTRRVAPTGRACRSPCMIFRQSHGRTSCRIGGRESARLPARHESTWSRSRVSVSVVLDRLLRDLVKTMRLTGPSGRAPGSGARRSPASRSSSSRAAFVRRSFSFAFMSRRPLLARVHDKERREVVLGGRRPGRAAALFLYLGGNSPERFLALFFL